MDLDGLLQKTSRTFALAIPLLPEPTRASVGLAYLLFRVADTFEDATAWSRDKRVEALERLTEVVQLSGPAQAAEARALTAWSLTIPPVSHAGYLELLGQTPALLELLSALPPAAREVIVKHTVRTAEGMARVVARADERGNLRLTSLQDLKDYCYLVAGIVGELLTELFLLDCPPLRTQAPALRGGMVQFGEGLQLVNILKDAGDDARDGRVYLPPGLARRELLALVEADLDTANHYVQALRAGGAPTGYQTFCGLSLGLAYSAAEVLRARGPGAKVPREQVLRFHAALMDAVEGQGALDVKALSLAAGPATPPAPTSERSAGSSRS